ELSSPGCGSRNAVTCCEASSAPAGSAEATGPAREIDGPDFETAHYSGPAAPPAPHPPVPIHPVRPRPVADAAARPGPGARMHSTPPVAAPGAVVAEDGAGCGDGRGAVHACSWSRA